MDAITFATIVGLLSEFVSQRRSEKGASLDEFENWLAERRHDEVIQLLRTVSAVSIGTKALLAETRDVLLARLTAIDRALVGYASAVEGFGTLVATFAPSSALSSQALDILRQIDASGASKVLELHHGFDGGTSLIFMDGSQSGEVTISDPRFLQDDLTALIGLHLLRPDRNSSGGRFFHFTRAAASLARGRQ
jgi:hypothetical protein